jgi:hypothetical protein
MLIKTHECRGTWHQDETHGNVIVENWVSKTSFNQGPSTLWNYSTAIFVFKKKLIFFIFLNHFNILKLKF